MFLYMAEIRLLEERQHIMLDKSINPCKYNILLTTFRRTNAKHFDLSSMMPGIFDIDIVSFYVCIVFFCLLFICSLSSYWVLLTCWDK